MIFYRIYENVFIMDWSVYALTIKDVAKLSGLSVTTVSRVINNHPYVSKEKREKVQQAMDKLSYTPNHAARKMRGGGTTSIGVIVKRIVNPFFSYLVDAIERLAYEHGYQVVIFQSLDNPKKEKSFLDLLKTKQVDGVIMAAFTNDWKDIEPYTVYGPIIFVNEFIPHAKIPIVRLDQLRATEAAIKHLLENGHRKIGYCTGGLFEADSGLDNGRNIGYQKALKEAGLKINPQWIFVNKLTIDDGKQVVKMMMDMDDRPTALFAGGDEMASGAVIEAKKQGLRVPEDLAVIGFDDQPLAELIEPQLTTVRQPIKEMGETAANIMIELLEGKDIEKKDIMLPYEIIIRKST